MKEITAEIARLRREGIDREYNNLAILADERATKAIMYRVQNHLTRLYIYYRAKDYHNFLVERKKLLKTLYDA